MKKSRQNKIIELVESCTIETQDELAEMLKNAGYSITQATVSRDIRDLKLTKIATSSGKQKYIILKRDENFLSEKYSRVFRDAFMSMDKAQNILVVKTVSGMAMAVAAALDALKYPELVGCIAGDDTVMAALKTADDVEPLMEKIKAMMNE